MNVVINDFAWIAICLAVISVIFIICVAFILLGEGLRIFFRKARQWLTGPSVQAQGGTTRLPAVEESLIEPAIVPGRDTKGYQGSFPQILAAATRAFRSKLHTTAEEIHLPFRWGHR